MSPLVFVCSGTIGCTEPDADEQMPTCPSQMFLTHLRNHVDGVPALQPTRAS